MDVAPLATLVEPRRAAAVSRRFATLLTVGGGARRPRAPVPDSAVPPARWTAVAQDDDAVAAALGALAATLAGYGPRQIYGYSA